ncbi:MAG: RidA family protein [Oscillospiraceae bacterium]|nr:RidA family protein [Oscillospiraceae bacterium]
MLTQINTTDAPGAIGPYSQGIRCCDMLFTSGQLPMDPKTGEIVGDNVTAQAHMVLKNLEAILKEGGADFGTVMKTTCFLHDMADFAAFNEVYASYFTSDPKPARSCIAAKTLPRNVLCEIEAVACVKK